ncbi:MAG: hypothetical protein ABSG86_18130 [Thermoguttaceae bacterium]
MRNTHASARRGVLLLVILGLLSMFAMVAVAFVVLTSFERQRGERDRRVDEAAEPPDRLLDQASEIVFRGSQSPLSAIHSQSLLEKIYGHETLGINPNQPLTMNDPQAVAGGQMRQLWEFTGPPAAPPIFPDAVHRIGAVLTIIANPSNPRSPEVGLSTRIVGVNPNNPNKMQIMAFDGGATPQAGDQYIINGVPYSGMGFGYDNGKLATSTAAAFGTLGATAAGNLSGKQLALLPFYTDPNRSAPVDNWSPVNPNDPSTWNPVGGANCDYTAPDFQDTLLAFQIPYNGGVATPLPSLHRPELIRYMGGGSTPTDPNLLRAVMARPNQIDHPNFTGSNPNFNPIWDGKTQGQGQWDVCNSGSGVPDSVWVDLGLPVRYTAEGKAYKPLFAILCLDLDGRLNVNAHGMLVHANLPQGTCNYYQNAQNCQQLVPVNPSGTNPLGSPEVPLAMGAGTVGAVLAASSPTSGGTATLARGLGYGPAEVNLLPLFADPSGSGNYWIQQYQNLLVGSSPNAIFPAGLNGRYGEMGLVSGNTIPQPGVANWLWPDTFNKWWDYQGNSPANANNPSSPTYWYWSYRTNPGNRWVDAYGSPPDTQGYGAVAVDVAGRPLFMSMGGSCVNTPYDLNLSRKAAHAVDWAQGDDPYGPAELESLLRRFDRDAPALPTRLLALTSTDTTAFSPASSLLIARPYAVTTESESVPTPGLAMPPALRAAMKQAGMDRPRHIVDLLVAMGVPQSKWPSLLPVEMLSGLKLNLNRPLSNWAAGSPNGFQLYAQPGNSPNWTAQSSNPPGFTLDPTGPSPGWPSDPVNTPNPVADPIAARQLQARYLYVLATLLGQPSGALQAFTEFAASDPRAQQLTQRRIAQWAINAVCFSTPDSVMVPFKYPLAPSGSIMPNLSQGWPLRDNILDPTQSKDGANFGVVWGAKPPELLLTETLAFHDRRVADTRFENNAQVASKIGPGAMRLDQDPKSGNWMIMDQTLDQTRIPQGSAFIEVFCPRSPRLSAAPADLYMPGPDPASSSGTMWYLDLGQLAGASPGQPGNGQKSQDGCVYPVWRIVITESCLSTSNPNDNVGTPPNAGLPQGPGRLYQKPDSTSLEPQQVCDVSTAQSHGWNVPTSGVFSLLPGSSDPNVTIERIVWFAPLPPVQGGAMALDGSRVYYNRGIAAGNSVPLAGGRYAVVGPARSNNTYTTAIGSMGTPSAPGPPQGTPCSLGTPSQQKIVLMPSAGMFGGVIPTSGNQNVYPNGSQIQQPVGIPVGGGGQAQPGAPSWPPGWSNQTNTCPNGIGLSISEPLFSGNYYPEPTAKGPDGVTEWYGDYQMQNTASGLFRDLPLESAKNPDPNVPGVSQFPIVKDNIIQTGTTQYYKTVFLQRLANPSAAYDPINNPYRTVDWMPIDLTVFNGEDQMTPAAWAAAIAAANLANPPNAQIPGVPQWDPDDPNYGNPAGTYFSSRQRGTVANLADPHYSGSVAWNLWAQISDPPLQSVKGTTQTTNGQVIRFPYDLQHTLGYINSPFWNPAAGGQIFPIQAQPGWITQTNNIPAYIGDPLFPWPWLTWNGRPYVSEMELLLVPATSAARLPWEFSFVYSTPPFSQSPGPSPYPDFNPAGGQNGLPAYPHLVDFFQSEALRSPTGTGAMELHRLLEFVGVPSRFDCAQTQIPPNSAIGNAGAHWYHPPFNRVSNYRDPGKINLNTIPSPEVLQGLLNYFPGMTFSSGTANTSGAPQSFWSSFVWSRRGYAQANPGGPGPDPYDPWGVAEMDQNHSYPTRFANPFRSPSGAAMQAGLLPTNANPPAVYQREVDATLLRGSPDTTGKGRPCDSSQRPLFESDDTLIGSVSGGQNQLCSDYNRNAFFRYQELQRLANCVTTRSNVFAVWITVGYFEVMPWTGGTNGIDAGHPDGWQLGQEMGSDTGKIERHRAFYIFDRSIPVGFIRGRDVNQDNALLVRRFVD